MTLLALLVFGGALGPSVRCAVSCWPTEPLRCAYEARATCRAGETPCEALPEGSLCYPLMVNLGEWDPRPEPAAWPKTYFYSVPPAPVQLPP